MDWKKAKPFGVLNMIQGQTFSGLIPIRPLKIHLPYALSMRASYHKSRSVIQPEVGVGPYNLQALMSKHPKRPRKHLEL